MKVADHVSAPTFDEVKAAAEVVRRCPHWWQYHALSGDQLTFMVDGWTVRGMARCPACGAMHETQVPLTDEIAAQFGFRSDGNSWVSDV